MRTATANRDPWRIRGRAAWTALSLLVVGGLYVVPPAVAQPTVGLFQNDAGAYEGYTIWNPRFERSYMIDNTGRVVHTWDSTFQPGNSSYLLPTGNLLRTAKDGPLNPIRFTAGGFGGRVEEIAWDGTIVWSYLYSDDSVRLHHDIHPLPNGNVLMIAWELKTQAEAIQAGRDPALISEAELWPDHIIEVQPVGATGANIVWEWHVWDHLIQDFDLTKDNFGVVTDHPELLDINHVRGDPNPGRADWMHANAIDYNAEFAQIMIGSNFLNEFYVIDHSTTTAEAAGHTGGSSGKGGDFLYRWGNPQAYDRGVESDRTLFGQHHPHWIEPGLPGEGNILVFNNGLGRPGGTHSSVDEFTPPVDANGDYFLAPGQAYGPTSLVWTYTATPTSDFSSNFLSGAQRLPNGNTLICEGRGITTNNAGNFFEVTNAGQTVWQYVNPVISTGPVPQGTIPNAGHNTFRILRYPPSYPGFDGEVLTPGDPLETFTAPFPVPEGAGATSPLIASRLTPGGDSIRVEWDAASCPATDYNLTFGDLADVSEYTILGSECALGAGGTHDWLGVPGGSLYFLIVGVDITNVYESSWGTDGSGTERNGVTPSGQCGVTYKILSETCP